MRSNQVFNLGRFIKTCRLEIANEGRYYLSKLVISILLVSLPLFQNVTNSFGYSYDSGTSSLVYIFGCSILMFDVLSKYNISLQDIASVMIPASTFEKVIASLAINLFFIGFLSLAYVAFFELSIFLEISDGWTSVAVLQLVMIISLLAVIQSWFFLGSLFFRKYSYAKTSTLFVVIILGIFMLNQSVAKYLADYPGVMTTSLIGAWKIQYNRVNPEVGLYFDFDRRLLGVSFSEVDQSIICGTIALVAMLGFWLTTYFRLKEKEV